MKRYLWVIEFFIDNHWEPTTNVRFVRSEIRDARESHEKVVPIEVILWDKSW